MLKLESRHGWWCAGAAVHSLISNCADEDNNFLFRARTQSDCAWSVWHGYVTLPALHLPCNRCYWRLSEVSSLRSGDSFPPLATTIIAHGWWSAAHIADIGLPHWTWPRDTTCVPANTITISRHSLMLNISSSVLQVIVYSSIHTKYSLL